jgi:general secretion pathway protein A
MMTNLETFTEKLLQIVLVGQPELDDKLRRPQLRQLRQRVMLRAKTHPLQPQETAVYIAQRLRIAGSNGHEIFTPEAVSAIHRYSHGIPRVVNLICEHCLINAFADQERVVTADAVKAVAHDFELEGNGISSSSASPSQAALDLSETAETLVNLAERLRDAENEHSGDRKP